jgi:hypothetical protein
MKAVFRQSLLALALAFIGISGASAGQITGSIPFAGFVVGVNGGTPLADTTTIGALFYLTNGFGLGDYSPIPVGTTYNQSGVLDFSAPSGWTLSNANYGTFTAASILLSTQNASFINFFVDGTYTPGPTLLGLNPTLTSSSASLTFTVTRSDNGALSAGATLDSPTQVPTPEPTSMVLLGGALLGIGFMRRRAHKA